MQINTNKPVTTLPIPPEDPKTKEAHLRHEKVMQVFCRQASEALFSPLNAAKIFFSEGARAGSINIVMIALSGIFACVGLVTSILGFPVYLYERHLVKKDGLSRAIGETFDVNEITGSDYFEDVKLDEPALLQALREAKFFQDWERNNWRGLEGIAPFLKSRGKEQECEELFRHILGVHKAESIKEQLVQAFLSAIPKSRILRKPSQPEEIFLMFPLYYLNCWPELLVKNKEMMIGKENATEEKKSAFAYLQAIAYFALTKKFIAARNAENDGQVNAANKEIVSYIEFLKYYFLKSILNYIVIVIFTLIFFIFVT